MRGCFSDTLTSEITTNLSPELYIISTNNVGCQNLGTATFEIMEGNEPFIFLLNGSILPAVLDAQNQYIISDLEASLYELTVPDNFLCSDTIDFEILNDTEILLRL